jgi:hypothetical protein
MKVASNRIVTIRQTIRSTASDQTAYGSAVWDFPSTATPPAETW